MVNIEKIQLCYDASPDLEWVASQEAQKFIDVFRKLESIDSLSVGTYLHQWAYSSELVFDIEGNETSLEKGLRTLYKEAGIPAAISNGFIPRHLPFLGHISSRKAIEISEAVIKEINSSFNPKSIYVDSCTSRHQKKTA